MDLRFCDLGVKLEGTWVEECLESLSAELGRRGLRFRPHAWLWCDWFTPDGVPGIAIPFYLVHPRLMKLERSQMLEVEGGSRQECLRILRHECGHAIQHAFQLARRAEWRRHFGSPTRKYPEVYRPNPASRRFVQHLRLYYAQSHPVEDFAETFAVWLQPRSVWRRRYAGWPALRKLEYVDRLMSALGDAVPPVPNRRRLEPLARLTTTLGRYYEEKRGQYSLSYPDRYDRELRRLFSDDPKHRRFERASHFLRRNRADIRRRVARWTGEHQFTLDLARGPAARGGQPRRQLPRTAPDALHRLQSARADDRPRQGAVEEDRHLPPRARAAVRHFPRGRKVRRPAGLAFPLFVKSLTEEASLGIAQASLVTSDEKLEERGIFQRQAQDLPEGIEAKLRRVCRRIMRMLELDGYARLDFRLREDGELFFLEMPRGLLSGNFPRG